MPGDPIPATTPLPVPPSEHGHAALDNPPDGIVWEADGSTFRFTFVSPRAETILGYPIRQWLDEPDFWRKHTHPDDVAWCAAFCHDATARGRDHEFEYRMIAADGRVVWLRDVVTVVRDHSGALRLRGVMLDVSERKRVEDSSAPRAEIPAGRLATGTETILLAEDDDTLRTLTRAVLEGRGYTVLEAADGRAAVELARTHRGRIDLLLTDATMPELSGSGVAEALTRAQPGLCVLLVSGYVGDVVVRPGLSEAGFAFLQKPFTPAALAGKVRDLLDGR